MADILQTGSSQQGIGDGMAEDVRIRMPLKAEGMLDAHPPEDEGAVHDETMDVVADARGDHSNPSSTLPLVATMAYFSA